MSVVSNNILAGASGQGGGGGGYEIERSVRFNAPDSSFLSRTPSSAGSLTTSTFSCWAKRTAIDEHQALIAAGDDTSHYFHFEFRADNVLKLTTGEGATNQNLVQTVAVFRDPSAWYHVVLQLDFTNATQADRVKIYVNGVRQDLTGTIAAQNYTGTRFNQAFVHNIGRARSSVNHFNGYLADVHFIDGQALAATDFGETDDNGVWQPKEFAGTYGTNGFHLDFKDNSSNAALGTDTSGNSNTWTVNNLSVAAGSGNDSLVDSPTNGTQTDTGLGSEVVGNYATLNPLNKKSGLTLSNGNLQLAQTGTSEQLPAHSTIQVTSGKWYFECERAAATTFIVGLQNPNIINNYSGAVYNLVDGNTILTNEDGGGATSQGSVATSGTGVNVGIAIDKDNESIKFYRENTLLKTLTTQSWMTSLAIAIYSSGSGSVNYGARPFKYTAPSGYKSLNTANLPTPTIADGSQYFEPVLWDGNSSSRAITMANSSMSPDFVWIKSRSDAYWHYVYDVVRGATKEIYTNSTNAEATDSGGLTSFDSNGFSLGSNIATNGSGKTFVGWAWDAGDSNTTIAAGGLNSSLYNQSQTWSSGITTTLVSGNPAANGFDGSSSTNAAVDASDTVMNINFSNITVNSTIEIRGEPGYITPNCSVTVGGTTTTAGGDPNTGVAGLSGTTTKTFNNVSGTLTNVKIGKINSGRTRLSQLLVDGKILVDSNLSITTPSIASTVRANPSAGFSIVSWSVGTAVNNSTIGHGLGAAPSMIICKTRNASNQNWIVYHKDLGTGDYLALESTQGSDTRFSTIWGTSAPNSTVFGVGTTGFSNNSSNNNYISYCFAPVAGYSAALSWTGNGTDNGSFIYTGFRPSFIIMKDTNSTNNWQLLDATRDPYNVTVARLFPNQSNAESSSVSNFDFLSNGLKARNQYTTSQSGINYIGFAFAENPFQANGGLAR